MGERSEGMTVVLPVTSITPAFDASVTVDSLLHGAPTYAGFRFNDQGTLVLYTSTQGLPDIIAPPAQSWTYATYTDIGTAPEYPTPTPEPRDAAMVIIIGFFAGILVLSRLTRKR